MQNTIRKIDGASCAVLGGLGFIGSALVDYLIEEKQCEVLVIDNLLVGKEKFKHPKAKFVWHDITHSEERLKDLLLEHKVEYVFNYVAIPYIPISFQRPLHVFDSNARGALMAMNASQEAGVKAFLQVSSAEIYGQVDGKIKETDPAHPHSTYGASKLAIDTLIQARWKEAKTPAIALRQFNVVGPRETHEYIVPVIIDQIQKNIAPEVTVKLGNNSFRDFQYVGDAVKMAVELLEKGDFGEVYNMGSEDGVQMYDLAVTIGDIMGVKVTVETDQARVRPWEIWHLQSDNSKLYSVIEGRSTTTLREALEKTISYYQENGCQWDYSL